ncbi:pVII [Turkey adenovirus 1]|uniref:PVII n=1 Tax=Turkey adenovirus 1 TaxID=878329 RepID=E0YC65_9ADEN|nr:pVII [Turkey adenovirus 1]ADM53798.1 pVII [Turkey adenovirus 1]
MSILISPSDNRGWGAAMRRRCRSSMRGVGLRRRRTTTVRPLTLRSLLGLGARRRRRGRASSRVSSRLVVVRTSRTSRRRRR